MALFRRKQTESVLPEVDEYYQAERRDRGWLAWILAFASVALVVLLIVGLFLGGRWAYNEITDNNEEETAVVTEENGDVNEEVTVDGDPNNTGDTGDESQADGGNEGSEEGQTDDQNDEQNSGDQAESDDAPAPTAPAEGDSSTDNEGTEENTSGGSTATPTTGDSSGDLPNTGPANLVGMFAGVTTLAGGIHYAVTTRKRK